MRETNSPALSGLLPGDPHDARLAAQVHPERWVNPTPRERYHLVVIGGGTGGLVSAAIGAALGAKVALVERHLMGGDCLNTGCVPSKAVLRAAHAWTEARRAAERFGGPAPAGGGDFAAAMERMRRIRADISPADSAERFREMGVDVFLGTARFTAAEAVEVGGATLRFRRAIVATGGRPALLSIPGLTEAGCLTSDSVWSLTALPERLVVIGGGPIGCELAQAFARFGSEVTLLEAGPRLLARDDADAATVVARALTRDGVRVVTGAEISGVEAEGDGRVVHFASGGLAERLPATHLLAATGRAPNVEELGLRAAGVDHGPRGIEVDARMRTSNAQIYAVGDVASRYQFTHAADAQARMVVRNALFFGRGRADSLVIPWATYTSPEVGQVGITAQQARERGDVETITVPFEDVDRARLDGDDDGFLRVHLRRRSDEILGATVVCARAGDLIAQLTQAMTLGIGLGKLGETVFPYPTEAEAIRKAADQWRRGKLTPTARRAFGTFLRVFD